MIVDAHVHFWDPAVLHYPWLAGVPALRRAFTPADYAATAQGRVDRVVVVEANALASESASEVAYLERSPAAPACIAAIVAYADMTDAGVEQTLDALASRPLVRGVRHNIQGHEAGFCTTAAFVRGVRAAGRRGLTFDLCITHDQLPDAVALARACPGTRFVLDHAAKPAIGGAMPEGWRVGIAGLAALENVSAKLSGLLTEARPAVRTPEHLRPYADRLLDVFGVDRVMFGSDWPVATLAGGFDCWYDFTDWLAASWAPDERQRLFAGTAAAVYGIDLN